MKIAVIITPFDNYSFNVRIKYIEGYLRDLGYENIIIISSDWNHRDKTPYTAKRKNLELLHVHPYKKNMSFSRVYSHYAFAKSVYSRLKSISPDFIYASVPPNFLVKYVARYKKQYPKVKVVCELGDLWPETLPVKGWKKKVAFPILKIWSDLRDKYIHRLDGIIYECNLFKVVVEGSTQNRIHARTIYLCKEDKMPEGREEFKSVDTLEIAYIGSINHLIDIELIVRILSAINRNKHVLFHIIGNGNNASRLFKQCDKEGLEYINHGIIYDDQMKSFILKRCAFGMNIMKDSVVVGVTMKSLEYFHWGMAVINNIPADTRDIVDRYGCGYNVLENKIDEIAQSISKLLPCDLNSMCKNSRQVYIDLFDEKIISKQFKNFIIEL